MLAHQRIIKRELVGFFSARMSDSPGARITSTAVDVFDRGDSNAGAP